MIGPMESVEDLYVKGLDLSLEKKYAEAILAFQQAIEKDPKYMDTYHSLAMTYLHAGDVDKAIETEQKAIEVSPNEKMSHANLSIFLQKKGLIKEAEAAKAKATILTWKQENKERKEAKENPKSSS